MPIVRRIAKRRIFLLERPGPLLLSSKRLKRTNEPHAILKQGQKSRISCAGRADPLSSIHLMLWGAIDTTYVRPITKKKKKAGSALR